MTTTGRGGLTTLLLTVLMAMQDPALPRNGTVTGILRTGAGVPAARVRVAATLVPSDASDISMAGLVSLNETDEQGRYVLENIPAGRYYIVAGRVDLPTFYPGKLDRANGTILEIVSGATISGIDFAVDDASTRPPSADPALRPPPPPVKIPVRVTIEGGGTLPTSVAGSITTVQLTETNGSKGPEIPIDSTSLTLPGVSEYNVRIVNLPDGYVVTSVSFNGTDLTNGTLRLPTPPVPRIITFTGEGKLQEAIDQASRRVAEAARTLSITLSRRDAARE